MCDKGARQPAGDDVCPQLQTQVVPGDGESGRGIVPYVALRPVGQVGSGWTSLWLHRERISSDAGISRFRNLGVSYVMLLEMAFNVLVILCNILHDFPGFCSFLNLSGVFPTLKNNF